LFFSHIGETRKQAIALPPLAEKSSGKRETHESRWRIGGPGAEVYGSAWLKKWRARHFLSNQPEIIM
jgi:hypothetical protein